MSRRLELMNLETNQNIRTFVLKLKKYLNHEHRRKSP